MSTVVQQDKIEKLRAQSHSHDHLSTISLELYLPLAEACQRSLSEIQTPSDSIAAMDIIENVNGHKLKLLNDAIQSGVKEKIQALLDDESNKSLLNQTDWLSHTPITYAVLNGHTEIAQFLVDKGANPKSLLNYVNRYGENILQEAILLGKCKIVAFLCSFPELVGVLFPTTPKTSIIVKEALARGYLDIVFKILKILDSRSWTVS